MGDHIFVSYAHEDRSRVEAFASRLRQEGWSLFLDDQIPGAGQWPDELHKAIRTSRAFVVMLSPDAMHSAHILNEINVALSTGRAIIPVQLEDTVLSPGVELLIGSSQLIDYSDAAPHQFEDVIEAIRRAFTGRERTRERKGMRLVGNLVAGLGISVIVAGFAMFFYQFYLAVSDPDPFARPDMPATVMSFVVFFAGMLVAGVGEGLRRAARRPR